MPHPARDMLYRIPLTLPGPDYDLRVVRFGGTIYLVVIGPRGSTRAIAGLSPVGAQELADLLVRRSGEDSPAGAGEDVEAFRG